MLSSAGVSLQLTLASLPTDFLIVGKYLDLASGEPTVLRLCHEIFRSLQVCFLIFKLDRQERGSSSGDISGSYTNYKISEGDQERFD